VLFKVYRRNKDKITGVMFRRTADSRSNFRAQRLGKMDYPFLFDEKLQPKIVFYVTTKAAQK
jgi:GH35 family endo-1,4-beta-xylanase